LPPLSVSSFRLNVSCYRSRPSSSRDVWAYHFALAIASRHDVSPICHSL
jgi:hypothetical protein